MHVPDGFLDAPTSLGAGALAAIGVALALRGARDELDDRTAPLTGLTAVFVFAGQMLNFPIGAGTSGHLLGGALAAILVGPWTATLALSVVLLVQAILFADGGITALGSNVTSMGIVAVWAGWFAFRGARTVLPRRRGALAPAAFLAGLASVLAAALTFVGLYALGGQAPVPLSLLATAMLGWHALIGVGEGVVTMLVVSSILAVRPDLVAGARDLLAERPLVVREQATR